MIPRFLHPEHVPFESCAIIPATERLVTHAAPADQRLMGGDLQTECGEWVKPWAIAADPTYPACLAKLAETAEDVFGAATPGPDVKSPQTWDVGTELFNYAVKLSRLEQSRLK